MDQIVLLDEAGNVSGVAPKLDTHHGETPLHLAFSCYLFGDQGAFLLTRRAESKKTWPGVWSNSCCGHPLPGERIEDSVRRRLRQELGIMTAALTLILPRFRYRAQMDNGIVENEWCPVFRARTGDAVRPDPAEVADVEWTDWTRFSAEVRSGARTVSPWCTLQVAQLAALGAEPLHWPAADPAQLPAACASAVG